jgi:hypothetical protein
MTLVYERKVEAQPATHAFVLGCGRFPKLGEAANRAATVAGARRVIEYLVGQREALVAPLGSIECLLSDPAVKPGKDVLGLGPLDGDQRSAAQRAKDHVDPVLTDTVTKAGDAWLNRCQPGDHMFFYMSSHGVADKNFTASGLFEDVLTSKFTKWRASLNINALALNLPVCGAGACWLFLDACQELIPSILGQNNGASGVILVEASPTEMANIKVQALALAGSRFGQSAWAPDEPEPPFFTQALLESFGCCVDDPQGQNDWVVTGEKLAHHIPDVANAAFGNEDLEVTALSPFAASYEFARVVSPSVPVVVRTNDRADMDVMINLTVDDGNGWNATVEPKEQSCFVRVKPGLKYNASASFHPPTIYPSAPFTARACGQSVVLKP